MKPIEAYYLSGQTPPIQEVLLKGVPLLVPELDPVRIHEVCRGLKARQERLFQRPVGEILTVLDRLADRWLQPDSPLRRTAEAAMVSITGLSPEMIRWALDTRFRSLRMESLEGLLTEAFSDPAVLDRFVPRKAGGLTRAIGPALTVQMIAGNIPGLAVEAMVFSLLIKSPTLIKPASAEPVLAALWAKSLAEFDPDLSEAVAVLPWKGGSGPIEDAAFAEAASVVAYGGSDTLAAIAGRLPQATPFIVYGPRLSVGVLSADYATSRTAEAAALDVARFEMEGCLSPQIFWVEEKTAGTVLDFAAYLFDALSRLQTILPAPPSTSQQARRFREIRSLYTMKGATIRSGEGFMVIMDPSSDLGPISGVGRVVVVKPLSDLDELPQRLTPFRGHLQGMGIALSPKVQPTLLEALAGIGISRICPIGKLQEPPLHWHQEGRVRLLDRVRWIDWEEG